MGLIRNIPDCCSIVSRVSINSLAILNHYKPHTPRIDSYNVTLHNCIKLKSYLPPYEYMGLIRNIPDCCSIVSRVSINSLAILNHYKPRTPRIDSYNVTLQNCIKLKSYLPPYEYMGLIRNIPDCCSIVSRVSINSLAILNHYKPRTPRIYSYNVTLQNCIKLKSYLPPYEYMGLIRNIPDCCSIVSRVSINSLAILNHYKPRTPRIDSYNVTLQNCIKLKSYLPPYEYMGLIRNIPDCYSIVSRVSINSLAILNHYKPRTPRIDSYNVTLQNCIKLKSYLPPYEYMGLIRNIPDCCSIVSRVSINSLAILNHYKPRTSRIDSYNVTLQNCIKLKSYLPPYEYMGLIRNIPDCCSIVSRVSINSLAILNHYKPRTPRIDSYNVTLQNCIKLKSYLPWYGYMGLIRNIPGCCSIVSSVSINSLSILNSSIPHTPRIYPYNVTLQNCIKLKFYLPPYEYMGLIRSIPDCCSILLRVSINSLHILNRSIPHTTMIDSYNTMLPYKTV